MTKQQAYDKVRQTLASVTENWYSAIKAKQEVSKHKMVFSPLVFGAKYLHYFALLPSYSYLVMVIALLVGIAIGFPIGRTIKDILLTE
jgi:hypothetical protein